MSMTKINNSFEQIYIRLYLIFFNYMLQKVDMSYKCSSKTTRRSYLSLPIYIIGICMCFKHRRLQYYSYRPCCSMGANWFFRYFFFFFFFLSSFRLLLLSSMPSLSAQKLISNYEKAGEIWLLRFIFENNSVFKKWIGEA